ncbi:MAG: hypothetical protein H0X31_18475 [Nostocaceae cyanobacterium]|nr:hypothetical protein [Nostocaceae cyanobacterium]
MPNEEMKARRQHINLKRGEPQFSLWRLTEEEYRQLRGNSLAIKEDGLFIIGLLLSERYKPERLTLPKALLTLEYLFGKSSDAFDDWKGSFTFPLLVSVQKTIGRFFYLMRIYDHRGSLCYPLYRLLEDGVDGYDVNVYHEPFENEFSRQEINELIAYLYGYLTGVSEWVCKPPIQPFLRRIDSNNIIYGYRDEEFFEEDFDSQEEYNAAIQVFEETYGSTVIEQKSVNVRLLIEQITNETLP